MRLTAALILVGTAYAPPGGTAYATPTTVRPHRVPLNVSTITSADGPWFDYWRAVGGDAKAWDQMDDHERAWLRVAMTARLAGARRGNVAASKKTPRFDADRLEAFAAALNRTARLARGFGTARGEKPGKLAALLARETLGATRAPDRRLFVIVTMQRTGSSWLTDELRKHPCMACRGEVFLKRPLADGTLDHFPDESKYRALVGLVDGAIRPTDPFDIGWKIGEHIYARVRAGCNEPCSFAVTRGEKRRVRCNPRGAAKACGFKWMLSQGIERSWDAWFLRMAADRGVRLIFLHRTNVLRRFYSAYDKDRRNKLQISVTTKHAPVVADFPLPLGSTLFNGLEEAYRENEILDRLRAEADALGVRTLRTSFENMMSDKSRALTAIEDFVLADHPCRAEEWSNTIVAEKAARLHSHPLSDNVTNWNDVVAALRGTKFEPFLTMDGSRLPD